MERYVEISAADLFEAITKDNVKDIYFQENSQLYKATNYQWSLNEFKKKKWFKREVIE